MELNEIKYYYVIDLTKYFLEKYKTGEIKDFEHLIRCVKSNAPFIQSFSYKFDEEIWLPSNPELYKNLIEFRVQLNSLIEYLPFRLMISRGSEQMPIFLNNMVWTDEE